MTSSSRSYDAFLSFRGSYTRNKFTGHLHSALRDKKVHTFMDKELQRGEEISSTLFQIIENSHVSVVIFSKNYASSTFFLDELVKIIECRELKGQVVFPVFYDVDPLEVEKLTGHYGDALSSHEAEYKENMTVVQEWRSALAKAADLSGWDLRNRDEAEVIREIVQTSSQVTDPYR